MSDPWVHRLSDYIDDDLLPQEREELEQHLRECDHCRRVLDELTHVVERAQNLEDQFPPRDLWPEIAKQLDADASRTVVARHTPAPARFSFSRSQVIAAVLAVMMISGAMGWLGGRLGTTSVPDRVTMGGEPLLEQHGSLEEFSSAIAQYQVSIEQLEEQLQSQVDNIDPETLDTINRNLRAIDDAIFESRKALTKDPESEYLNAHLAASIGRKVRLLRQANNLADNRI